MRTTKNYVKYFLWKRVPTSLPMGRQEHNVTSNDHNEIDDRLHDNFGFSDQDDSIEHSPQ